MKSKKQMKYITDFKGLDLELFFCSEVLKLDALHYGLWKPDEEVTLDNLKTAQHRYSETLIDSIPRSVRTILDVGCGMGDLSRKLADRGFNVTALSPDENHVKFFENRPDNLKFVQSRFENFKTEEKFDLIVMSESQGYFHADHAFTQCRQLLNPGGFLLVSGMFRKDHDRFMKDIPHIEEVYVNTAKEHGLVLSNREDITDATLPTLELTYQGLVDYAVPLREMGSHFFRTTSRVKAFFLKMIFRTHLKKLDRIYKYYMVRSNPEHFKAKARYLRLFFEFKHRAIA